MRLGDIALKIGSGATPRGGQDSYLSVRKRFAFVRSQNVLDRHFDRTGLAFISDDQAEALRNVELQPSDVLLNITGDGVTFSRACIVPTDVLPACVNQHVAIIRLRPTAADPGYVLSFLAHPEVKSYIESFNAGGSRRAITKGHIESFRVALPRLEEQRAIAHILGALDEKIELNQRMSATLEAIARALFKSWFVDFDPVKELARPTQAKVSPELAALFPDKFSPSDLGSIPTGWRVTSISEVARRIAMGPFGSDIKTDNFMPAGVPVVRGGNLTNGFMDNDFVFVSEGKADQLRNANAFPDDIVITHRGTLGQVGIVPRQSRFPRYVVSQSQMLVSANEVAVTPRYLYEFLRSDLGQQALLANTSQTGVPAIARPTTSLRAIRLILPPLEVLTAFDRLTGPMFERVGASDRESRCLATIRDTLLPKLMTGQIRIKDAERIAARYA